MAGSDYNATTEGITAVEDVEVDITVRGDQDRADKVLMDLKERIGVLAVAFDSETPPDDVDEIPAEYIPMMTVAWDRVFEDEEGDA